MNILYTAGNMPISHCRHEHDKFCLVWSDFSRKLISFVVGQATAYLDYSTTSYN